MNNLKFRVWDKKLQIFGTVSNIDLEFEEVTFYIDDDEELETCQLSGSVGRVYWCVHNTGFFYYVEKDKKHYTVFRANHNLEIIGNIYEKK